MRLGLREMKAFSKLLFPSVKDSTFFESCGVADLITTCCKKANQFHLVLIRFGFSVVEKPRNRYNQQILIVG
jgi:hypothetical protein